MGKVLVTEQYLTDIADAIREKLGVTTTYKPSQMGPAIETITGGGSTVTVPSYWKSTIADKAATIRGRDGYQFCFFTDVHWEDNNRQSPALIRQLMIDTGADCCVCGGDLIVQQPTKADALAMLAEVRDAYGDLNVAYCVGNHDLNSAESSDGNVYLTEAEWRGIFDSEHTGVTYYTHPDSGDLTAFGYRDHPESKIREIFVNTGGMAHTNSNNAHWAAAMIWACQRITELSSDWGVLVFAHIWWAPTGHMAKQSIATTIENYISKYASNRQAELIAIITGHTHDDYYDYSATEGYLITSTSTDSGDEQASIDEANPTRTAGTTLEQCFDVITVDRQNKMLYFDRIGAGSSRALPYYQQPTYTVTYSLTDVASSNGATSAQGGTSYTTTLTAASGKKISTVTVTMGGTDITATAYSGGVVSIASVTGNVTIAASAASSKPTWTNLVPTSLATNGSVYNSVGYKDGKYLSNTTATLEGGNDANFTLTGRIPYSQADFAAGKAIAVSGLSWTTDDHCRFIFLQTLTSASSTPYCKGSNVTSGAAQNIRTYFTLTEHADYWTLTPIAGKVTTTALTYIAFSFKGAGASLSIGVIE